MTSTKKLTLFISFLIFFSLLTATKEIPKLTKRIHDFAHFLTASQETELEGLLVEYENKTSTQFALLTIPSLEGENLESYSIRVASQWKLGQKSLDNGVLLLVTREEKKVRIEVGYGLEHILTDLKADYIINQTIIPQFKQGTFFAGIKEGFSQMGGLVNKEFDITPEQLAKYQKNRNKKQQKDSGSPLSTIIFIVIFLLLGGMGGRRGGRRSSGIGWFLLGSALGGSGRSSGSGFGGGFGGFSGGGGGFGGGGASGGW